MKTRESGKHERHDTRSPTFQLYIFEFCHYAYCTPVHIYIRYIKCFATLQPCKCAFLEQPGITPVIESICTYESTTALANSETLDDEYKEEHKL